MQRPLGITLIALLEWLVAAVLMVLGAASALGASLLSAILTRSSDLPLFVMAIAARAGILVALFMLAFAVFMGVLGYGIWSLRRWARITTLVLAAFGTIGATIGLLWSAAHFQIFFFVVNAFRVTVNIAILWYLDQRRTSLLFV